MTAPTFSPARVVLIVLLAFATAWAIGTFAHNATPMSSEHSEWSTACQAHTIPCAP